jgi:uncharacterized protein (DUF2267 family)
MKAELYRKRSLGIVSQGDRLNKMALAHTQDINEGRLMVHGVLSRALHDRASPDAAAALEGALHKALGARPPHGANMSITR